VNTPYLDDPQAMLSVAGPTAKISALSGDKSSHFNYYGMKRAASGVMITAEKGDSDANQEDVSRGQPRTLVR